MGVQFYQLDSQAIRLAVQEVAERESINCKERLKIEIYTYFSVYIFELQVWYELLSLTWVPMDQSHVFSKLRITFLVENDPDHSP